VKFTKLKALSVSLGCATLLGASAASAQVVGAVPTNLIGSDTLNTVMDTILGELRAAGELSPAGGAGVLNYNGIGSSAGERQLEGSPSAEEPACLPNDPNGLPENNPGCQEISPMSRHMDSSICEDDNAAANAEGIAICRDGIVIVTNNAAHQQFAATINDCKDPIGQLTNNIIPGQDEPVFPDMGTGNLRNDGVLLAGTPNEYVIGAGMPAGEEWMDVVW